MVQTFKKCDACGQAAALQARTCEGCGKEFPPEDTIQRAFACPHCFAPNCFLIDETQPLQALTCSRCHGGFVSHIVRVRSKDSQVSRLKHSRRFALRVHEMDGKENVI